MLRNLAWQATDDLTRTQFALFQAVSDDVHLTYSDRRQALGLTEHDWALWNEFLNDGPLPSEPALPEMILRLGQASYTASVMAELRRAQSFT